MIYSEVCASAVENDNDRIGVDYPAPVNVDDGEIR